MRRLLGMAVCLLALAPELSAQTIQGLAVARGSNDPISSGIIILFDDQGNEAARTRLAQGGRFTVTAPAAGRYRLRLDAIGYRTTITPLFDLAENGTLAVTLEVRTQTAVTLDTVDVAGGLVSLRMAEFDRRRRAGFGSFMTREEFEPFLPARITDVMRRMRGFSIVPNPRYMQGGDTRRYLVFNSRVGVGGSCPPLIFVDGMPVGTAATFDFDGFLTIGDLEAIELYNGPANVPVGFHLSGAHCGVIAMWTRVARPAAGPASSNHLDLGWQVGARLTAGGAGHSRIGAQAVIGLADVVELSAMVNTFLARPTGGASISGRQTLGALRVRPLGARSGWYLGTGFTSIELTETSPGSLSQVGHESHHVMLSGLTVPLGRLRPFVEVQVLSPLSPSRSQVHLFTGLGLRLH